MSGSLGEKDYHRRMAKILAIAHLKLGEVENWIKNRNAQSSIFPITAEGQFGHTLPSEHAREYFLAYLQETPHDLEEKWLLNLTCMTLGKYPEGVAPDHRIPLASFKSKENMGRFLDVSTSCGLNLFWLRRGCDHGRFRQRR